MVWVAEPSPKLSCHHCPAHSCCSFSRPAAATVGVPDEAAVGGGAAPAEALVNQSAIDLLRRLPGEGRAGLC